MADARDPDFAGPPEASTAELSSENRYARFSIKAYVFRGMAERLGVDVSQVEIGKAWTLQGLASWCASKDVPEELAKRTLEALRGEAFGKKYADYGYEDDLRGLAPAWLESQDVVEIR